MTRPRLGWIVALLAILAAWQAWVRLRGVPGVRAPRPHRHPGGAARRPQPARRGRRPHGRRDARRVRCGGRVRARLRRRPALLGDAAPGRLPAARGVAERAGGRRRAGARHLPRLRARAQGRDRGARLLLPRHRERARRPALGRPRVPAGHAHAQGVAGRDLPPRRAAVGAAVGLLRRARRSLLRRDRGALRRVRRRLVGPRQGDAEATAQLDAPLVGAAVVVLAGLALALFGARSRGRADRRSPGRGGRVRGTARAHRASPSCVLVPPAAAAAPAHRDAGASDVTAQPRSGCRTPTTWASTSAWTRGSSPGRAHGDPAAAVGRLRPDPARRRRRRPTSASTTSPSCSSPSSSTSRSSRWPRSRRRRWRRSSRRGRAASTRRPTCAARRSASTAREQHDRVRRDRAAPCRAWARRRSTSRTSASTRCPTCSSARWTPSPACSRTSRGSSSRQRGLHPVVFPYDRYGVPAYDELVLVANADRLHDDAGLPARRCAVRRRPRRRPPDWAQAHPAPRTAVMRAPRLPRLPGRLSASVPATLELLRAGPLSAGRLGTGSAAGCTARACSKSRPDAAALIARP